MGTPTPALDLLNEGYRDQQLLAPTPEDMSQWLTRYIFVPFCRPVLENGKQVRIIRLTPFYQSQYGLTGLKQGIIQPIARFRRPDLDYSAVKRVPEDQQAGEQGTSEMDFFERSPMVVVAAILRDHNPLQDNGMVEIDCLRGTDDRLNTTKLQMHLLPEIYSTAAAQQRQLEKAMTAKSGPEMFREVGQVLQRSTEAAIEWGALYYQNLQQEIEQGIKRRMSPRDTALCAWLEVPEPKLQSKLANIQQAAAQAAQPVVQDDAPPQIQCESCGTLCNLLPDGRPPKFCVGCRTAFVEEAPVDGDKAKGGKAK